MFTMFFIIIFLLICTAISANPSIPKDGYVPNSITAIKIAEAILIPIYGEDDVIEHRPYIAELKNEGVWIIQGTLKKRNARWGSHCKTSKK